ncbi:MAG: response regulator [Muribaculaceae bacterium]
MFESVNIYIVSVAVVVLASVALLFVLLKNKGGDASDGSSHENGDSGADNTNPYASVSDSANDSSGNSSSETIFQEGAKNGVLDTSTGGVETRKRPDTGGLPYVLVAEDNISNYKLIEVFLRNVAVTENAVNGKKAVERVREMDYDMVLMDIKMPVMNGLEATKAIRQFDKNIPIVAVTANVLDFDRKTALANGCNEFVTKPVVRNQLIAVVETYKR